MDIITECYHLVFVRQKEWRLVDQITQSVLYEVQQSGLNTYWMTTLVHHHSEMLSCLHIQIENQ